MLRLPKRRGSLSEMKNTVIILTLENRMLIRSLYQVLANLRGDVEPGSLKVWRRRRGEPGNCSGLASYIPKETG